jgi:hypothetical protein
MVMRSKASGTYAVMIHIGARRSRIPGTSVWSIHHNPRSVSACRIGMFPAAQWCRTQARAGKQGQILQPAGKFRYQFLLLPPAAGRQVPVLSFLPPLTRFKRRGADWLGTVFSTAYSVHCLKRRPALRMCRQLTWAAVKISLLVQTAGWLSRLQDVITVSVMVPEMVRVTGLNIAVIFVFPPLWKVVRPA